MTDTDREQLPEASAETEAPPVHNPVSAAQAEEDACYEWLAAAVTALPRRTVGEIAFEAGMTVDDVSTFMGCIRMGTDGTLRIARGIIRQHLERLRQAIRAGQPAPPSAHDVEEAMRPYLGEVWEAEQDDRAMGSHPTRLERAYRAALDHLLELNGVHR